MSGVRNQVCDGCWRSCRYANFKPLKDLMTYQDMKAALRAQVEHRIRTGSRAHITRATVLGKMHEAKKEEWEQFTGRCPKQGEIDPQTIEDFLEWALDLHAVSVRIALGMTKKKAYALHSALKVHELAAYFHLRRVNSDGETPF